MTIEQGTKKGKKRDWTPYLLIFPSAIYLTLFFAWPMLRGLVMAVWNEEASLSLHVEAQQSSPVVDLLPHGTYITVLDQQGNFVPPEELEQQNLITEIWFHVSGEDADGQIVEGWASESRVRVREEAQDGTPIGGSIRTKLGKDADPLTSVFAESNTSSAIVGKLESRSSVEIHDFVTLEVWYLISGEVDGQIIEGWTQSRYIQVFSDSTQGRIDRGNTGQWTLPGSR